MLAEPETGEAVLDTLPLRLSAILQQVQARLQEQQTYHLRRLINATGVIVHTNLGRSLLAPSAVANLQEVAESYSNLEYDLQQGEPPVRQHQPLSVTPH